MSSLASSFFKAGRTAVITGGASGIGLALARRCQAHGMRVLVADWDDELLALLARKKEAASTITSFKMDVSQSADWAELAKKVDKDFGGACFRGPVRSRNSLIPATSAWCVRVGWVG